MSFEMERAFFLMVLLAAGCGDPSSPPPPDAPARPDAPIADAPTDAPVDAETDAALDALSHSWIHYTVVQPGNPSYAFRGDVTDPALSCNIGSTSVFFTSSMTDPQSGWRYTLTVSQIDFGPPPFVWAVQYNVITPQNTNSFDNSVGPCSATIDMSSSSLSGTLNCPLSSHGVGPNLVLDAMFICLR